MLAIVATIVAATAAGVAAERRFGERGCAVARRALSFVLYVLLPPIIFFNLARARIDTDAGVGLLFGLGATALTAALAWLVCARVLRCSRPVTGAVMVCALIGNTGYLGYPVTAALLGFDELGRAVPYDVLVSGSDTLIGGFSVGAAFGATAGHGVSERVRAFFLRNPPLFAAVLALLAPDALAPDPLVDAARVGVIAILPIGFFAVGTALAQEVEEGALAFPPRLDAPVATAVLLRMAVCPALLLALSAPLIDLPSSYLLLAAMPCGINSLIIAHAYGLDLRVAAGAIAWSTALALAILALAAAIA